MYRLICRSTVLALVVVLTQSCNAPEEMPPTGLSYVAGRSANVEIVSEDCNIDNCHPEWGVTMYYETGGDPSLDEMECPEGCTTYPLGTNTRAKIEAGISYISPNRAPMCANLYRELQDALASGNLRWYRNEIYLSDGRRVYADTHPNHPNQIHVGPKTFTEDSNITVANTLAHEGFHRYYARLGDLISAQDEPSAEYWASACLVDSAQ